MKKLVGNDIQKTRYLFDEFNFYQPFIFSIFENQYDGSVYVDNHEKINWALLQTPFLQHVIAGKPTDECESIIEDILFSSILNEQNEKEIVVFYNNNEWDCILKNIFSRRNGVSDSRKIFGFSQEKFMQLNEIPIPDDIQVVIEKCKVLPFSKIDTWSVKILFENEVVSHCDSIMVGKNMAEIDIFTVESFRGKGYASIAGIKLIKKLLGNKITPCWSTWPFRIESQHIALKLGFTSQPDIKAWIWLESMQNNKT